MLLSVSVCKHELWLSAPKVLAASIDRVRLLPIGRVCWIYGDRIVRRFGDHLWGGEFLECAIEGFWEAIGQLLQFFGEAIGNSRIICINVYTRTRYNSLPANYLLSFFMFAFVFDLRDCLCCISYNSFQFRVGNQKSFHNK
jgi:hypothetical protein